MNFKKNHIFTNVFYKLAVEKKQSIDQNAGEGVTEIPPLPMRKLSRSQSITTSAIPTHFFLPPGK